MKILAVLDVDENKLEELGSDFTAEMGWVEQSGIHLVESREFEASDYEYTAFVWNKSTEQYEQFNKAWFDEDSCRIIFQEYVKQGWINRVYDTSKVIYKRRIKTELEGQWETIG